MSVLLYAVTDEALDGTCGAGLEGRPLRTVSHRDLRAIVGDVEAAPSTAPEALWAYDRVVTRLMDSVALLPARFGTTAPSDAEITAMLDARADELGGALERVRGALEFAVHVESGTPRAPVTDPGKPGTAYLLGLRAGTDRLREFEALAGDLVRARTRRSASAVAFLVDRDDADRFRDMAWVLGFDITGPWPPYSFVGGAA